MPQRFTYETVPALSRDLYGPDGRVINLGRRPGAVFTHWMDEALARAWFARARDLADALYAAVGAGRAPAPGVGPVEVLKALMQGYNALNVPWYVDPEARGLWRRYIAGPPQSFGSQTLQAQYGQAPYNPAWFGAGEFPGLSDSVVGRAVADLVASTPELSGGPRSSVRLSHTLWPFIQVPLGLVGADARTVDLAPLYASTVQNAVAVGGFVDHRVVDNAPEFLPGPIGTIRRTPQPRGPNVGSLGNDLWAYGFATDIFGFKRIGVPQVAYTAWLADWARAVVDRSPRDVVASARTYAAWANATSAASAMWGGAEAFVQRATNLPAEVLRQQVGGSAALATAAQATAAIGGAVTAALAPVPVASGVAAIITGLAAGSLAVANALSRQDARNYRDDLGRYKPVVERGWLSGDASDPDEHARPAIDVPDPPGWRRPTDTIGFRLPPLPDGSRHPPVEILTPEPATPGGGVGGAGGRGLLWLALFGAAGYGAYRWLGRGSRVR